MFSTIHAPRIEAILFGNEEALLINDLRYLLGDNRDRSLNYRDGKYWITYTPKELAAMWPNWSEAQIQYRLTRLREKGVLVTANNNKSKHDRTLSYTFADDKLIEGYRTWADVAPAVLSVFMSGKDEKELARYGFLQEPKTGVSTRESSQQQVDKSSSLNDENPEMQKTQVSDVIRENAQKDRTQSSRVIEENTQKDVANLRDVKSSNSHITSRKITASLKRREDTNTQVFVSSSPQKERAASPCQAGWRDEPHEVTHTPTALHDLPDFVLLWDSFVRLYNERGSANEARMDAHTAEGFTSTLCEFANPVGVLTEALRLGCTDLRMIAERVEKQDSLTCIARQACKSGQAPNFTQDAAANRILASALATESQEWPTRMQNEMVQQPTSARLAIEYLQPLFEQKAQALASLYTQLVQANRISEPYIEGGC